MMTIRFTPLDELSSTQIDKVLEKFQLVGYHHSIEKKIEIVKCIALYDLKFGQYQNSDVLVGFNKAGNLHDMKSSDETVKLFDDTCTCNTCGKNVDKKDVGMRCDKCTQFFHNKCTSSPVSTVLFNHIVTTTSIG